MTPTVQGHGISAPTEQPYDLPDCMPHGFPQAGAIAFSLGWYSTLLASSTSVLSMWLLSAASHIIFSGAAHRKGKGDSTQSRICCVPWMSFFETSQGTHENLSRSHITSCAFITELLGLNVSILSSQSIFQSKSHTFICIPIQKFSLYFTWNILVENGTGGQRINRIHRFMCVLRPHCDSLSFIQSWV